MKLDSVTILDRTFYAGQEVFTETPQRVYVSKDQDESVDNYVSVHKISASASNEVIGLDEDTNTQETWLFDLEGAEADDLTVKTNSYSTARAVKPLRIISGRLTALTVSNSDSVNPKYLGILRIVPTTTDSTKFEYLEQI